ncbi:hypothetical protein Tco_0157103 [Tanacetum coccineum]
MGEGSANPTDPYHTPTIIQLSTSRPQKKQKPRKPKRKDTEVPQPSGPTDNVADEAVYKEMDDSLEMVSTTTTSLDAEQDRGNINKTQSKAILNEPISLGTSSGVNTPRSDEDSLKLKELIKLCTNLQNRVIDLEKTKTSQAQEIISLKRRVKRLENKNRSKTHGLKILYKVGLSARIESSKDEGLGEEDASKQGRIDDIDANEEIYLVNIHRDENMFGVNDLDGDEVIVETEVDHEVVVETEVASKDVNLSVDEVTLAQALAALKSAKTRLTRLLEEQEKLSIEEKSKLFVQLLEARKKHFEAIRAKERRNKPPTKSQKRNTMSTYLKNMAGYKHNQLKNKSFDDIQKLFDKAMKRFKESRQSIKRQKVDEDKETAELQRLIEVIPGKDLKTSDSGPDISFDISASPGYTSGLGRASPAKVIGLVSPSKYNIPCDLHPRLPPPGFVMSELPDDAILIYHCSYNQADVQSLSAFVVKLRDMPEGVLVLSGLSRVWKSRTRDPILRDSSENVMGIHDFLCFPEWTGLEVQKEFHHDVIPTLQRLPFYYTPPDLTRPEYYKKQRASTSGVASSQIAKHTRSTTAPSLVSFGRATLFDDNDSNDEESEDDDEACYEILIIIPICSAATILVGGYQGGGSGPSASEGPGNRGKAIMNNVVDTPNRSVDCSQAFTGPVSDGVVISSYEVSREEWGGPHKPTLSILTKEVFKDPNVCKTMVDKFPTPEEMVRIEALTNDHLTEKMSVLHCLMMSHRGELLARYKGLPKSHGDFGFEEIVTGLNDKFTTSDSTFVIAKAKGKEQKKKIKSLSKSMDQFVNEAAQGYNHSLAEKDTEILWLKASPPEFMSFFKGGFQSLVRKFLASDEFSRVQGELLSLAASAGFERGLNMDQTQEQLAAALKKIPHSVPSAQSGLAEATPLIANTDYPFLNKVFAYSAQPLSAIVDLEPDRLARPTVVLAPRAAGVSPPLTKELTVTPAPSLVELFSKDVPPSYATDSEQNEEWLNVMVDMAHEEMIDSDSGKLMEVFVQGATHSVNEDVNRVESSSIRVSELASSSSGDAVIALSIGEKEGGSPIPQGACPELPLRVLTLGRPLALGLAFLEALSLLWRSLHCSCLRFATLALPVQRTFSLSCLLPLSFGYTRYGMSLALLLIRPVD